MVALEGLRPSLRSASRRQYACAFSFIQPGTHSNSDFNARSKSCSNFTRGRQKRFAVTGPRAPRLSFGVAPRSDRDAGAPRQCSVTDELEHSSLSGLAGFWERMRSRQRELLLARPARQRGFWCWRSSLPPRPQAACQRSRKRSPSFSNVTLL